MGGQRNGEGGNEEGGRRGGGRGREWRDNDK